MNKISKKKKKKFQRENVTSIKTFQRKNITDLKSFRLNYITSSEIYGSYRFKDQVHSKIDLISWSQFVFFTRSCL